MTNTFNLSCEYLNAIKEHLLKGVPIEDQSRLMIGFLDEVDFWIRSHEAIYGYDEAVKFKDEEIERYMNDFINMDSRKRMAIFVKDDNIKTLWNVSRYLKNLKKKKRKLSLSSCKVLWNFAVDAFEKCEPYIRHEKVSALRSVYHRLTEIKPSTSWYFLYEFKKMTNGFSEDEVSPGWNIKPEKQETAWKVIAEWVLLPLYIPLLLLSESVTYAILKFL